MIECTPSSHRCRTIGGLALAAVLSAASVGAQQDGDHEHDDGSPTEHLVPLFPAAINDDSRQGFVRVINHSADSGEVAIHTHDDSGREFSELTLSIGPRETIHFNSNHLEGLDPREGLSGMTGAPDEGDWRLTLSSDLDIEVLSYIRTTNDGFLTSMNDLAPSKGDRHRVPIFNPGSNLNQVSSLRIINPADEAVDVTITGIDDAGNPGEAVVHVEIGPGASRTLTSEALEHGQSVMEGSLGDGQGKWQLSVEASHPVYVLSLMSTPTGHLTNLSAAPTRGAGETAREAFDERISGPVVQTKCIQCHVAGGAYPSTVTDGMLVFVPDTDSDHMAHNFTVFRDFVADHDDEADHNGDHDTGADHILQKIQGMASHGGGVQIAADDPEFADMERFLELLEAEIAVDGGDDGHGDHDH